MLCTVPSCFLILFFLRNIYPFIKGSLSYPNMFHIISIVLVPQVYANLIILFSFTNTSDESLIVYVSQGECENLHLLGTWWVHPHFLHCSLLPFLDFRFTGSLVSRFPHSLENLLKTFLFYFTREISFLPRCSLNSIT